MVCALRHVQEMTTTPRIIAERSCATAARQVLSTYQYE